MYFPRLYPSAVHVHCTFSTATEHVLNCYGSGTVVFDCGDVKDKVKVKVKVKEHTSGICRIDAQLLPRHVPRHVPRHTMGRDRM